MVSMHPAGRFLTHVAGDNEDTFTDQEHQLAKIPIREECAQFVEFVIRDNPPLRRVLRNEA